MSRNIKYKVCLFLLIGVILGAILNSLFTPRWNFPIFVGNATDSLATFFELDKQSIDVIFLGTSHGETGISPMQIYMESGVSSYNLCTSGQPLAASYYLLREALKTQTPSVVMLDVSALYRRDQETFYHYVIDNMPMSRNKLALINDYALLDKTKYLQRIFSEMNPVYRCHTSWNEMKSIWSNERTSRNYITAGYWIMPTIAVCGQTKEDIDYQANEMLHKNEWNTTYWQEGEQFDETIIQELYHPRMQDKSIYWVKQIQNLCSENGIELSLIKVPSLYYIQMYEAAWTKMKSEETKQLSDELGINFYDLQYDVDLGIDNTCDFSADVGHLNHNGAKKVSHELSIYLKNYLNVNECVNKKYEENMEEYLQLEKVVNLNLAVTFSEYIEALKPLVSETIIMMTANNDMSYLVNEDLTANIEKLGLASDLSSIHTNDAFLVCIDCGTILCEEMSNRECAYGHTINDTPIDILSRGYDVGGGSHVMVNSVNTSFDAIGLNIVVVDARSMKAISSVYLWDNFGEIRVYHKDPMKSMADYWFDTY